MSRPRRQFLRQHYQSLADKALQEVFTAPIPVVSQSLTAQFVWRGGVFGFAGAGVAAGLALGLAQAAPLGSRSSPVVLCGVWLGDAQSAMLFAPQSKGYAVAVSLREAYAGLSDSYGYRLRGPKPKNPLVVFGYFAVNDV